MNKFVNTVIVFLFILIFLFAVVVGRDIQIGYTRMSGQTIPYKEYVFIGFAALFLLIGARRSVQRWMGMAMIRNTAKYQLNIPIGNGRRSRAIFYLILEGIFHAIMAIMLISFTKYAAPIFLVLMLLSIDHFLYALVGRSKNMFRIGVTKSAVVLVDRDIRVLYFTGLRKISVFQHNIFFDYIKDLVLELPDDVLDTKDREQFKDVLINQLNQDRVYIDESFRNY